MRIKTNRANSRLRKASVFLLAFAMSITMLISNGMPNSYANEGNPDGWDWYKYANSIDNNSVVDRATPRLPQETKLKWTAKVGSGWTSSPTPPIVDKNFVYSAVGSRIVQLDKKTGKETELSKKERAPFYQERRVGGYASHPILYAEGKFFVQLDGGALQCVDAKTLKPLWVAIGDKRSSAQTISNISYKKIDGVGYVYLGTWNGENNDGTFFAVKIDEEDITEETAKVTMVNSSSTDKKDVTYKVKKPAWTFIPSKNDEKNKGESNRPRGFYWSGAYVTDKYLAIGTDDGAPEGQYIKGATLYTLNPKTGEVIDSVPDIVGDIRTSISYDGGHLYYSTKGGHVHKTEVSPDGQLGEDSYVDVKGAVTSTPIVYKDRIYVGVEGKGQFDPNSEHRFAVIDNSKSKLDEKSVAYTIQTPGSPKATALLSKAYENVDFDKGTPGPDGRVYLYFAYNAHPGGIYSFYDLPGAKKSPVKEDKDHTLYVPETGKQNYCISPIVADSEGTLYYKNDSGNIFAVGRAGSVLESLDVTDEHGKSYQTDDGKAFKDAYDFNTKEYTLKVDDKVTKVNVNALVGVGDTLKINDKNAESGKPFEVALEDGKTVVSVKTSNTGDEKTYKINIIKASDNANAYDISVNGGSEIPPWVSGGEPPYELKPAFSADQKHEMVSKANDKLRSTANSNLWVTTENNKAVVNVEEIENVNGEITRLDTSQSKNGHKTYLFSVKANELKKDVKLKVVIKSENGKKSKTYLVTIGRQYHVEEIKLNKTTLKLDKDAEETLTYTTEPVNADNKDVEWTSTNPNVAKVDENGKVTAISRGEADIKATSKDGKKVAICKVTVNAPKQDPITIYLTIANKTALNDLKGEIGSRINIPAAAKGKILDKEITLNDGDNLMDAIKKELSAEGISYKPNKSGSNFSEILGLKEKIGILSISKNGREDADMSGWTYTLNLSKVKAGLNQMKYGAGLGQGDIKLEDGDELVINYTVDGVNVDKEYKQSFSIDQSEKNIDLTVGDTYYLPFDKLKVEPESWAAGKKYGLWLCYGGEDKIATMEYDKKGFKIVAKSAGKTTIKVEMPNEISDEVTVNVKPKTTEKPEPRILIDGAVWDMNKTFEATSQGPHSMKVQIKKNGQYVDVDTKKIKWEITNGATSRVWNQSFWITVDHEATFKATLEEYPNENVFFKAKLKPVTMTDFEVKLPTTYKINAWNNLSGTWSSKTGGGYFVGISEGVGSDNYQIVSTPSNAVNKEVTWEALTPEIATFMDQFKNGIIPVKAGKAKFKVTSKANPQLSKIVEINLEYKTPMNSAEFTEKEITLKPGQTINDIGIKFSPERPSEQRFNWTFDKAGIVENEEIVESTGKTGDLPKFIHKITAIKEGTVTATATPWDMTGGAKPITLKINVIGDLDISDLENVIKAAEDAKKDIKISADGKDVEPSEKWTTDAEMKALEAAISEAKKVKEDPNAKQEAVEQARTDLENATKKFKDSLKDGTKEAHVKPDKTELENAIKAAEDAKKDIKTSADGKDVEPSEKWTTDAEMKALEAAISEAKKVDEDANAKQDVIGKAESDLEKAIKKFKDSLKTGKKAKTHRPGTDPQDPSDPGTSHPGKNPSDKPTKKELKVVTEGQNDNSTLAKDNAVIYTKGESTKAVFRIMGEDLKVKDLESVLLDGKLVASSNYDVRQGSIIVTFKKAYLDSLGAGKHEVTFNTTKGIAKAELVIKDKTKAYTPSDTDKKDKTNTGDTSDTLSYCILVAIALGTAYFVSRRRKTLG